MPSPSIIAVARRWTISMQAAWYAFAVSISSESENRLIITCCGSESPAVWLRATSRLSATMRSMNFSLRGSRVIGKYRLSSAFSAPSGSFAIILS